MSRLLPKHPGLRLKATAYATLRRNALERDGWKCQVCGAIAGLEVHHIQHRSQLGDDSKSNLISLCADCHRAIHG